MKSPSGLHRGLWVFSNLCKQNRRNISPRGKKERGKTKRKKKEKKSRGGGGSQDQDTKITQTMAMSDLEISFYNCARTGGFSALVFGLVEPHYMRISPLIASLENTMPLEGLLSKWEQSIHVAFPEHLDHVGGNVGLIDYMVGRSQWPRTSVR